MKNELNWNKFKRCLAMANWCIYQKHYLHEYHKTFPTHKSDYRMKLQVKWHYKWLELAEKFKPEVK